MKAYLVTASGLVLSTCFTVFAMLKLAWASAFFDATISAMYANGVMSQSQVNAWLSAEGYRHSSSLSATLANPVSHAAYGIAASAAINVCLMCVLIVSIRRRGPGKEC